MLSKRKCQTPDSSKDFRYPLKSGTVSGKATAESQRGDLE